MGFSYEEKLALLKINAFSFLRADWLGRLLDIFGSPCEILKQSPQRLSEEGKISIETAGKFLDTAARLNAEAELEKTEKANGRIYFKGEPDYPQELLAIKEPPLALYVRGVLPSDGSANVGMVGTRKITPYGRRAASKLGEDLALSGVVLVSGLARGVDTVVHASAVRNDKPTIALIGTGIGRCYPAENRELARGILDRGGAIISELPFDAPPLAQHFPRRNRLIAAFSKLVVVVEGEIKSGALITAKMALEQGKDVLAVPGPIDSPQSAGPNNLIREGAAMVLDARDIIDTLPLNLKLGLNTKKLYNEEKTALEDLSPLERQVVEAIGSSSVSTDDLAISLAMPISELSGILFNLEVGGVICCEDGKYSRRKF